MALLFQDQHIFDSIPVFLPRCASQSVKQDGFKQPCYGTCAVVGSCGVLRFAYLSSYSL